MITMPNNSIDVGFNLNLHALYSLLYQDGFYGTLILSKPAYQEEPCNLKW